ncbi:hypothetical protein ES703_121771 [subsurface metagenome]
MTLSNIWSISFLSCSASVSAELLNESFCSIFRSAISTILTAWSPTRSRSLTVCKSTGSSIDTTSDNCLRDNAERYDVIWSWKPSIKSSICLTDSRSVLSLLIIPLTERIRAFLAVFAIRMISRFVCSNAITGVSRRCSSRITGLAAASPGLSGTNLTTSFSNNPANGRNMPELVTLKMVWARAIHGAIVLGPSFQGVTVRTRLPNKP